MAPERGTFTVGEAWQSDTWAWDATTQRLRQDLTYVGTLTTVTEKAGNARRDGHRGTVGLSRAGSPPPLRTRSAPPGTTAG